jgi:hypothetical protein
MKSPFAVLLLAPLAGVVERSAMPLLRGAVGIAFVSTRFRKDDFFRESGYRFQGGSKAVGFADPLFLVCVIAGSFVIASPSIAGFGF